MIDPIPASTFLALARASTASVTNAVEHFKVRLRNEGYLDTSIIARAAPDRPMLGYALTLEMRTDLPPARGAAYSDRTDWWESLTAGPHPKIIVIADVGETRATGSVAGEVHAAIFKALGAVGLITDGAIRDVRALQGLDLHVFSSAVSPSHGYGHIVSVGQPVTVGGMKIATGDLLHGDQDGVTAIPLSIADDLAPLMTNMLRQEDELLRFCRSRDYSVDALRRMLETMSEQMGPG